MKVSLEHIHHVMGHNRPARPAGETGKSLFQAYLDEAVHPAFTRETHVLLTPAEKMYFARHYNVSHTTGQK